MTRDRQLFMKRLRSWLHAQTRVLLGFPKRTGGPMAHHVAAYRRHRVREACPRVKFIGCGERGSRGTKRVHWHLVVFASGKTGLVSTARDAAGQFVRKTHHLWKHGFCTVDVKSDCDIGAQMRAVRYCVKYVMKSRALTRRQTRLGERHEARFFASNRPALGREYLMDHARRVARAGVPLDGKYRVPGVHNSYRLTACRALAGGRMPGAPRASEFMVLGRMRDHTIAEYRAEWERVSPERRMPVSDWQRRHDADLVDEFPPYMVPLFSEPGRLKSPGFVGRRLPPAACIERGECLVRDRHGAAAGLVVIDGDGLASFDPVHGGVFSVGPRGVRDVPGVSEASARGVDAWIAARRGPDWLSPGERRIVERDIWQAKQAAIERFAQDSPNVFADHPDLPELRAPTGLRRKLRMVGSAYVPGVVVVDDPGGAPYVRGSPRLVRSIHKRPA